MVALESLPLGLTTFVSFWESLSELDESGHESEKEFMNLLCTKCTNFRDYIISVLTQERRFLNQDTVFEFFKSLTPKVRTTRFIRILISSLSFSGEVNATVVSDEFSVIDPDVGNAATRCQSSREPEFPDLAFGENNDSTICRIYSHVISSRF